MKTTIVLLLTLVTTSFANGQEKASLFDGLLNVVEWIRSFNSVIENIDNRESLKRLRRELSYLSTDISEITNSKKYLLFKAMKPDANPSDYGNEVQYLQEAIRIFQNRFQIINQIVPSEFKVENNPLTQNIDNLIWEKMETLEKVSSALYGNTITDSEVIQKELEKAIEITQKIERLINKIKLKIEEKLE